MNFFKRHKHEYVVTYCEITKSPKYYDCRDYGFGHTNFSAYCKTCGNIESGQMENIHFTKDQLEEFLDARKK